MTPEIHALSIIGAGIIGSGLGLYLLLRRDHIERWRRERAMRKAARKAHQELARRYLGGPGPWTR